jgi:ABC-type transporter Mla MlaB component
MERKTLAITGDVLRATAAKLWSQLPQFKDIAMPKWSA